MESGEFAVTGFYLESETVYKAQTLSVGGVEVQELPASAQSRQSRRANGGATLIQPSTPTDVASAGTSSSRGLRGNDVGTISCRRSRRAGC
jgi:hypothetical protein